MASAAVPQAKFKVGSHAFDLFHAYICMFSVGCASPGSSSSTRGHPNCGQGHQLLTAEGIFPLTMLSMHFYMLIQSPSTRYSCRYDLRPPLGTSRTASNPLLLSLPTLAIACRCSTAHHMLLASTHTPRPQCPHHCTATAACHPHTACTGAEGSGQGQLWHCVQGAAAGGWWGVCHEGN